MRDFRNEKECQGSGCPLDLVLKDILGIRIPQNEEYFKLNGIEVSLSRFAFTLYSEVLEYLFDYGYTMQELKEEPERLEYELINAANEAVRYGDKVNYTNFEARTENHFKTIANIMNELSILLEER